MSYTTLQLLALLAASVVVLAQSLVHGSHSGGYWVWAVVCSSISTFVCAMVLLILEPLKCMHARGGEGVTTGLTVVSVVLAFLWLGGTFVMTFKNPYTTTGNGYFAAWAAFIVSWLMVIRRVPQMSEVTSVGTHLGVLLVASAVVLVQTSMLCSEENRCTGNAPWLVVCSAISLCLCIVYALPPVFEKLKGSEALKFIACFFLAWWTAGAFMATFEDPFRITGNGYFGCWTAFVASALLVEKTRGISLSSEVRETATSLSAGSPMEILVLFVSSLVTLVAAAISCGNSYGCGAYDAWAIVCPVGSLAVCFAVLLCKLMDVHSEKIDGSMKWISLALLAWWIAGTGCMTFEGPFVGTGNGYFASWVSLLAVLLLNSHYFEAVRATTEQLGSLRGPELALILLFSAVLAVQALVDFGDETVRSDGEWVWAIVCSFGSLVFTLFLMVASERICPSLGIKWPAVALLIWWTVGVAVLTFDHPYMYAGNAYFALWGALCACVRLVRAHFPELLGCSACNPREEAKTPAGGSQQAPAPAVVGAADNESGTAVAAV